MLGFARYGAHTGSSLGGQRRAGVACFGACHAEHRRQCFCNWAVPRGSEKQGWSCRAPDTVDGGFDFRLKAADEFAVGGHQRLLGFVLGDEGKLDEQTNTAPFNCAASAAKLLRGFSLALANAPSFAQANAPLASTEGCPAKSSATEMSSSTCGQ